MRKKQGKYLFTSESVTEGHPDKICDQISDSVLDEALRQDINSRVAIETAVKSGSVWVFGEMTTKGYINIQDVVRKTIKEIGYTDHHYGFHYEDCGIQVSIEEQSPDIALGVDESKEHEQGAGDQGMMFGYATNETKTLMPLPISLAHALTMKLAEKRKSGAKFLGPDGKSQVTVLYESGKPKYVDTVVVSTHHSRLIKIEDLREFVKKEIILETIPREYLYENIKFFINPTGKFVIGGPKADSGLTGRKIIVDSYGGVGAHGGGAFSGKDPSKVDRSGAYVARYIAKNIVAAGLAEKCEIQIAYAIGVADPVSLLVYCYGTNKVPEEDLEKAVRELFPLKPKSIIKELDLLRPIYKKTAAYGHFGRELPEFTWEKTDKVDALRSYFNI